LAGKCPKEWARSFMAIEFTEPFEKKLKISVAKPTELDTLLAGKSIFF
jgi:hypothetical protein